MSSDQLAAPALDPPETRPAISAPDALSPEALADARRGQPKRGLAGLVFVLPVAGLIAAAAGGPANSDVVLAPIVTFALPLMAITAFWWEDWPGSLIRGGWSGLYDTAIVAVGSLPLTVLGLGVVRGFTGVGITVGPGPVHGAVMALAGGIFTITVQLTLVRERWPLGGLGRLRSGIAALVVCWVVGVAAADVNRWVTHATLNALSTAVILHVAVWRR